MSIVPLTLRIVEERLHGYGFIRISRGDVINEGYIYKVWKNGTIELKDSTRLRPSRRRKAILDSLDL